MSSVKEVNIKLLKNSNLIGTGLVCKNIKILAWYSNDFQSQISTVVAEYRWCLMSSDRYHIHRK